ncbi:MAG: hypothetical protein J4G16_01675 [Acidobacteria bacterium]|nr:hypothetical protein [Acidobacteriota bacterium]
MMRRMWLRAALVAVLGVSVTAGYYAFLTGQRLAQAHQAGRAFDAGAWRLRLSLAELRAAQQAYVAAGQDRDYWVADVAARIEELAVELATLSSMSTLPATAAALDEAASLIEALLRMDERARDHAAAGEELMASDLIFADGLDLGRSAADQIERARLIEREAVDAAASGRRQLQLVAVGGAAGAGVLFALLVSPFPAGRPAATPDAPEDAATEGVRAPAPPEGRLLLDLEPEQREPPAAAASVSRPPSIAPDLRLAADLCTDLGRSANADELPPLLARTAQLLNASCVIVWVRDGTGNALRPAIAHGYPAAALARLGTIRCDSDNVTAAAYRDERLQVIPGDADTPGALVAPLASAEDRAGVMTLEVNDGWETSDAVQSTATIIAAQLATLVAADPSG